MSPTEEQQDPSQSPAEPQVESAPTSHVEDVAETSPYDERVAALLEHSIDVPVLAEAVEQQEAADAADTLETLPEEEAAEILEQMDDQSAAEALAEMQAPLAVRVMEEEIDEDISYAAKLVELMAPDDAADLLQEIGFPVFARGLAIQGTLKEEGGFINRPVIVGEVTVMPGDVVRGDRDGVVVIPRTRLAEAIAASKARENKEAGIIAELKEGKRTLDLYGWSE